MGGQDIVENDWRWTEGPEGEANGGSGTPFWNGKLKVIPRTTEPLVPLMECLKIGVTGEPNGDAEDYLQISQGVQPDGSTGAWNDLRNTNTTNGDGTKFSHISHLVMFGKQTKGNLVVNDDVEGGGFEIGNALFQKFILAL